MIAVYSLLESAVHETLARRSGQPSAQSLIRKVQEGQDGLVTVHPGFVCHQDLEFAAYVADICILVVQEQFCREHLEHERVEQPVG